MFVYRVMMTSLWPDCGNLKLHICIVQGASPTKDPLQFCRVTVEGKDLMQTDNAAFLFFSLKAFKLLDWRIYESFITR